jgi:hypothetical protein
MLLGWREASLKVFLKVFIKGDVVAWCRLWRESLEQAC